MGVEEPGRYLIRTGLSNPHPIPPRKGEGGQGIGIGVSRAPLMPATAVAFSAQIDPLDRFAGCAVAPKPRMGEGGDCEICSERNSTETSPPLWTFPLRHDELAATGERS